LIHAGTNERWLAQAWFVPSRNLAVLTVTNGGGARGNAVLAWFETVLRQRIEATP